ncbi:MAG: acyl-CoA dehydrogenase family protein [Candidatus Binatia bacterium]
MREAEDTPEQAEFRERCRRWLAANAPAPPPFRLPQNAYEVMTEEQRRYLCDWQKKCYEADLIACDFPKEYGGHGHSGFQRIATAEVVRAGVPYFINWIGLGMAAPTIYRHGTEAQKQRFLRGIFSADDVWCQGFSEPGAGSDLAAVQTFAEKRGDTWLINGHKVWTSLAKFASWMLLLARTGHHDKYGGLTYFIVPIAETKGVTVRPIIKMTGEYGFNEVLFEDLEIADDLRVDQVGQGWTVAMTTLTSERGAAENAGGVTGASSDDWIADLLALVKATKRNGRSLWEDPVWRERVAKLAERAEGMKQNQRRALVEALTDHPMRIPLQWKTIVTELNQAIAAAALEIAGMGSTLYVGDPKAPADGKWPLAHMNTFGVTISGGSNEVQRNILGERVLGLAKSK